MVLAIQCTVWSMILVVAVVAAITIAAVVESVSLLRYSFDGRIELIDK